MPFFSLFVFFSSWIWSLELCRIAVLFFFLNSNNLSAQNHWDGTNKRKFNQNKINSVSVRDEMEPSECVCVYSVCIPEIIFDVIIRQKKTSSFPVILWRIKMNEQKRMASDRVNE